MQTSNAKMWEEKSARLQAEVEAQRKLISRFEQHINSCNVLLLPSDVLEKRLVPSTEKDDSNSNPDLDSSQDIDVFELENEIMEDAQGKRIYEFGSELI